MRGFLGVVVAAVAILLFAPIPTYASSDSLWRPGETYTTDTSQNFRDTQGCTQTRGSVMQQNGTLKTYNLCVWHGASLQLAIYTDNTNQKHYAIRVGFDQSFRNIASLSAYSNRVYLRASDDALIMKFAGAQSPKWPRFHVYRLAEGGMTPVWKAGAGVVEYRINSSSSTSLQKMTGPDESAAYPYYRNYAFSDNREHIVGNLSNGAIITTNTLTDETKIIASENLSGALDLAISDDGRYAVIGSMGWLYDTQGCGATYDYALDRGNSFARRQAGNCQKTDLSGVIKSNLGLKPYNTISANFYFTDDDTVLAVDYPRDNPSTHLMVQSYDYNPNRLDYLALGDSYSSGEGDVAENDANYMADAYGSINCHLSTNSYPFLLRDHYMVAPDAMRSVACSGAMVLPDYIGHVSSYIGQHDQTLSLSDRDRKTMQDNALSTFSPGIVPQIEFVKKYKPGRITLTGGGNDVGFAEILKYCASPSWQELVTPTTDSCQYAKSGSLLHTMLYDSIDTQARYTARLLQMIKEASPDTNVILVGYPQFISSSGACAFNSGFIDGSERIMITEAVTYMNQMLKNEAAKAGVVYADIEDSLYGGRMCEGSEYVTGVWGLSFSKLRDKLLDETFHPNAKGHQQIASSIIASGALNQHAMEPSPDIETMGSSRISMKAKIVDGELEVSAGSTADVETSTQTLADGTTATTAMFSDEINLGEHIVSDDGALRATIDTSQIPLGRHVLVIRGLSPSGEELTLYQFVTAVAPGNDADADGVPDDVDRCLFITQWYDERTGDDVCDSPQTVELEDVVTGESLPSEQKISPGQINNRISDTQVAPSVLARDQVMKTAVRVDQEPSSQNAEVLGNSINATGTTDTMQNNGSVTTRLWLAAGISIVGAISYAKIRKKY